ncbi:MAG: NAD-dependent epimerase/dehydratase family protein [Chloroflexota bacterium]|nr:NAD-dependent epimerase/dehydratase family protein [Chloroflexota bacterium]
MTGGSGFVGSHVARALLAKQVAVRVLVRSPVSPGSLLNRLDVELVAGDLNEPGPWMDTLAGCDTLFHLAAYYSSDPADAHSLYQVNLDGTQALLTAAAEAGIARVVHTSTIGTIGRPDNGSLPYETTPFNLWRTGSHYVRSKWLGEAAALLWNRRGLPVVVVHPTAPVGAGDWRPTATGGRFIDFLEGRRPDYPAGGMNLCPVTDIAAGHLAAAIRGTPGSRYILGHADGNLDEEAFISLLSEVSGLPAPPAVTRKAGRRPAGLTADPARAITELGMPQGCLREAIADAVAYYEGTRKREISRQGNK